MHPLLIKQERLHKEATELLEQVMFPVLEGFGEVMVGGSYAYNLLYHPDIDIDIKNPNLTKEMYVDLCNKLISLSVCSGFKTLDRVQYAHDPIIGRPKGYWLCPEVHFGENVWKLDIWFQLPEWNTGDTNRYQKELDVLNEEGRISILSLKEELLAGGLYGVGKEFQSVDVYNAVLNGEVKTISDLREYKSTRKTS